MIVQINLTKREAQCFDIRKLTPKETGRLMGLREESLDRLMACTEQDKMRSGDNLHVSVYRRLTNSSLYKLFGNSIVVDVLAAIYKELWYHDPSEHQQAQLSLFAEPEWHLERPKVAHVATLCSGYDSQCLAFDALRQWAVETGHEPMDYELVVWAEFDPDSKAPLERQPAVVAHNALFPDASGLNVGDMTCADWSSVRQRIGDTEIDLLTYSTPCQSISQAGKRAGIAKDSGTRSAVLWYTEEAIRHLRPRILLQENVAALVNQQNSADFKQWRQTVERLGYRSYWAVLNARDYGILEALGPVPQNRERLFMVSVRQDLCPGAPYPFPNPMPLTRTIADVLDEDVPENFFLKPESVVSFLTRNESGDHCLYRVTDHLPTAEEIREWVREEGQEM